MKLFLFVVTASALLASCQNNSSSTSPTTDTTTKKDVSVPALKEETVSYQSNGVTMNGYLAYDSNKQGKRPGVLVVHEWWGLNDYPKMRARKLAELGYVALAVDMYGNGKIVSTPDEAGKMSGPFYQDLQMAKNRFDAALAKLKTYPEVDTSNIAAIGYCFGGGVVLNVARMGDDLKGAVSFHGMLIGAAPDKKLMKTKILVCHGEADQFVKAADVKEFKKQMDSVGAEYTFKQYPDASHAFTNPAATEAGQRFNIPIKYNAAADSASWNDMKDFLAHVLK